MRPVPARSCGSGFRECLHSPICRGEGVFVSIVLVLVLVLVLACLSSEFEVEDEDEDEDEDELIPALVSQS
jgi:hypothetical protein